MKKSLSLLLAIALVFGMFSASAFAATPSTPAEAGALLKELNVLKGDGKDLLENDVWKRQDIVVLLARLLKAEDEAQATAKSHTFADVPKGYYDGFLSWAKAKGYVNGHSDTKFGYNEELTVQQFSAIVLRALGINNDATVAEDAVKAGIFAEGTDFSAKAKRGDTFVALVAGLNAEVAGTGKTLGAVLGLPGFVSADIAVAKVAQTGAKKLTVDFNRALTAAEETALKAEVKNGLVNYPVTIKVSEDKKSAVLEATFLPAGEYDVTINALAAVKVTTAAEAVTKIDIGATSVQKAAGQDLKVKALNQFGEEVANAALTISTFVKGNTLTGNTIDLSAGTYAIDDVVVVTATHALTGTAATKTFKIVAVSSPAKITLGQVAPKKDETRIEVSKTGYVLPYTLVDQYEGSIKLAAQAAAGGVAASVTFGDVTFSVSDSAIVSAGSFSVDADGVLTFATSAAAGTVVITAFNAKTGAYHTTSVKVESGVALKTFQISAPAALIVKGEEVTIPYVAADNYGAPIAKADVPAKATGLVFKEANGTVIASKFKANGDLILKFANKGNVTVFVWDNNTILSQLSVSVEDVARPVSIIGTKDLKTTIAIDGSQSLSVSKLLIRDNYGRTSSSVASGWTLTFKNAADATVTSITGATAGEVKIKAILSDNASVHADVTYEIKFNVIAKADVKSVTIGTAGTVYAQTDAVAFPGDYTVTLSLTGKTADGTEVAVLPSDYFDLVTTSNAGIVGLTNSANSLNIYGVSEGTAVVTVWKDGAKLSEQTVTVSKAVPTITTVKFANAEYTFAGDVNDTYDVDPEVKDQYGVTVDGGGKYYVSKAGVVTINATSGEVTKVANGIVTITYVSKNGLSASYILNVENDSV